MNPILIAVPFFFTSIGVEVLIARLRGHAVHRWNDAIGSLALGSINITVNGLARVATYGIYALVWDQGRLFDVPVDEPLAWLAALILYDFLYYWFHRLSHERNILWAAHVVHHSSEEYNLTTALRQTGTGFLLGWIFYLPMAVLGVPPLMFAIVGLIDLLYQFWIHTREIGRSRSTAMRPMTSLDPHARDRASWMVRPGFRLALEPPGPSRPERLLHRPQLWRDPHPVGPAVRHLRRGAG